MDMIELGDLVVDEVTGYEGVVVSSHEYLFGCRRLSVQALAKEGEIKEGYTFDEPQLRVKTKQYYRKPEVQVIQDRPKKPGGPNKFVDAGKPTGERGLG